MIGAVIMFKKLLKKIWGNVEDSFTSEFIWDQRILQVWDRNSEIIEFLVMLKTVF